MPYTTTARAGGPTSADEDTSESPARVGAAVTGPTSGTSVTGPGLAVPGATGVLAVGVFLLDLLLLLANVAHLRSDEPGDRGGVAFSARAWNGAGDGSYVELFGHVQLGVAAVVLLLLARARWSGVLAAWSVVLLAVTADDLLRLHEKGGTWVVHRFGLDDAAGLRAQDLGELSVWALLAAVLGPALLVAHLRSRGADRVTSNRLVGLLALLAVFAVVVDMLEIVVAPHVPHVVVTALTLTETAGELLVMTAVLALAHATAAADRARDVSLP